MPAKEGQLNRNWVPRKMREKPLCKTYKQNAQLSKNRASMNRPSKNTEIGLAKKL